MAFNGSRRAADGLIVTFELADGSVRVEHFDQIVRSRGYRTRTVTKEGTSAIEQAAARADELDARILSVSSPTLVLTDLQGSRDETSAKRQRGGFVFPEVQMLGRIGRTELFKEPGHRRTLEQRGGDTHRRTA